MTLQEKAFIRKRRARRITILDAMVVIAATALGIFPARFVLDEHQQSRWKNVPEWVVYRAIETLAPVLVAWSAVGLILGLRRPRPTIGGLGLSSGFVACLATMILTLYETLTFFMPKALRDPDMWALPYLNLHFQLATHVGPAVAGPGWC